jgi:hypothetical protein
MADKVTKLRKSATATERSRKHKGRKGRGNSHPSENTCMLQWSRTWKKNTVEQTAQDEPEQIRVGESSSSQPPGTAMNTGPNEISTKRQRVGAAMAGPQIGATSFTQLFADTTGRRLDDLIDQNALA